MEKSKQRFALQDFSHIRASLVKGKGGWRIASVEALSNHYIDAPDKSARGSVVGLHRFLRRFFNGEEAAPALFEYVLEALSLLSKKVDEREVMEQIAKLHILAELGYVNKTKLPAVVNGPLPSSTQAANSDDLLKIEKLITQATDSSQL